MSDLSYLDPPIEIAATSPRLEMIMSRLRSGGMRPYPASAQVDFNSTDPLLVDISSVPREVIARCARACMAGLTRPLAVLDVAETGLALTDAITIRRDRDLTLLKGRLSALARRGARQREFAIRAETASQFGAKLAMTDPDASPSLLYLGVGSPLFLSLQGALTLRGVSVTAALTRKTTRDYLASKRFVAALVDVSRADLPVGMDLPDDLLGGVPVFAILDPGVDLNSVSGNLVASADEIIDLAGDVGSMATQIESLARRYQAEMPVLPGPSLTSEMTDLATGLLSRRFIEIHLARQMRLAEQFETPLSVMTLKLGGDRKTDIETLKALSSCLKPMLRDTDSAAVVAAGTIVVSMPSTPYRGAARLAGRIALQVAAHPALSGLVLNWRVVEKRAYHTPTTLLGAGLSGPFMRLDAA
ncbi:GGDEF domain-containing protein [Hyphomonas johnsonii]|uniref:Uncharacterized protein n=1 Tax=Hyphomonas johnsonii MHS-2 TaxID=1280950 RepID=A0A059FW50_9PROT|nr:GGDEF domain-containing protein [Hyphomonas johnsonii]KCZ94668.1 hypothetical protein HJO_04800 [Hyphomonas johnsonii MHS-2]